MSIGARVAAAAAPRPAGVRLASRLARGPLPVTEALLRGSQIADEIARAQRERRGLDLSAASVTLEPDRTVVGDGPATEPAAQMECLGRLLDEMTRPGRRGAARPPALEHVVARCLDPDPSARWEHPADVAEQLRFLATTTETRVRAGRTWMVAAGLAVAVAGLGWWWGGRSAPRVAASAYRFVIPTRMEGFTSGAGLALSPEGRRVVLAGLDSEHRYQLFVHSFDAFGARRLDGTADARFHAWSADGQQILFSLADKLQRMPAAGGPAVTLAELRPNTLFASHASGTWSREGHVLIGQPGGPLLHLAPGATTIGTLGRLDAAKGERAALFPVFLPDGERYLHLVYSLRPPAYEPGLELVAGRLGSDEVVRLGPATSLVKYAAGYLFSVREGSLVATPFDADRLRFTGAPVFVADDVVERQDIGWAGFDVAPDGTVLYVPRARPGRFHRLDAQGRKVATVGPQTFIVGENAALTPDAAALVVALGDRTRPLDLWMFGLDRPTTTRLTNGRGLEFSPVVGPDGQSVYFCREGPGGLDVYVKRLGSDTGETLVVGLPGQDSPTAVSPDGRTLLFEHDGGQTGADLYAVDLPNGTPRALLSTPAHETEAAFSPDGRWIAYESDATGRFEIYVTSSPPQGRPIQVSTVGARAAQWSRDGRRIVYGLGGRVAYATDVTEGRVGPTRELFRTDELLLDLLPLPDGGFLAGLHDEFLVETVRPHVIVRWPETVARP